MALSISASVAGQEDDAIEAMLDSIASQQDADAGPPADSGLTLSKYMVESSGGLFLHEDDAPGSISAWIPLDW
jgi:hypothetical protein